MNLAQSFHRKMISERMMFAYRGEITEKNSLPLLTLIENEMKDDSYGITSRKRLFMFVLESLQNIVRHGDHSHHADMSVVTYSRTDDGYTITTGNMIGNVQVGDLRDRLVKINSLDKAGLKELYLQILGNSEISIKGGAGLGLLEMAVKTGNKLDFAFVPYNSDFTYFILSKTVNSSGIGMNEGSQISEFKSDAVLKMERMMADNRVYMAWSGSFTPDVGQEVLNLTETRLSEDDVETKTRKRVFGILVEILENVSKYNPGPVPVDKYGMPVAIIGLEDERFLLSTGNLILNNEINNLKLKLEAINSTNRTGLKKMFVKSLSAQTLDSDSTGNLGLLDVALKSGSRLEYNFEPVNENYSYYTLTVKVGKESLYTASPDIRLRPSQTA